MNLKKKIIFLVGPTASGKSAVALELAEKLNCEIISCDSMQVYKELNIVSAKPSKSDRKKIQHHLIDVVSVADNYNVADYQSQAQEAIKKIHKKNKIPLIVGGSGLYIKVLLDGIFSEAASDKKIRDKLFKQAEKYGKSYLYCRLNKIDPAAANKIHPNDLRRIVRALEVYAKTKIPISRLQSQTKGLFDEYEVELFGLQLDRQELYQRINDRVDKMFESGLVKELKRVLHKKLSLTAKKIIGIKEIQNFLTERISADEAKDLLKRNTRHYAKRQLTWFRKEKRINWIQINPDENPKTIAGKIWKRRF
ncbi:MAG: tRNA (adenosine(37)-N6)-dimethylallyltransferase MiaA [Candidatus Omnitrophica bacterium]|nr:tRNA (adenosine(37)-N6)-dimethylallyltransferase MiaA [Candidatus Omnitrophota bacterium]